MRDLEKDIDALLNGEVLKGKGCNGWGEREEEEKEGYKDLDV